MNAEFAKTLKRRLYPLYESLIQSVKGFSYSKAFFCMQWGRNFPETEHAGILFVGRATNGWITDEEDIDVLFGNTADRIFNRDDQMQWVENSEEIARVTTHVGLHSGGL